LNVKNIPSIISCFHYRIPEYSQAIPQKKVSRILPLARSPIIIVKKGKIETESLKDQIL
jgi:uncharacterized membrane protein YcaP (DUF421 family)